MKKSEILDYLKANQDSRGISHWEKDKRRPEGLKSYGIGLTQLRKFAKSVGKDRKLAQELWETEIHEAKVISAALEVALNIGPIDFDPDGGCDPMDVARHLTSDYLRNKLGI